MFGEKARVSPLESRKQLLIAESEINRVQLSREWQTLALDARDLAHRAKILGAWTSSAALLVAGIAAWRRGPPAPSTAKASWFKKILHGARVASTIWLAFRARAHPEDPE